MVRELPPAGVRRAHYIAAGVWLVSFIPVVLFGWYDSLPLVVFISIYANVVGHWSSGMAMRVELNTPDR